MKLIAKICGLISVLCYLFVLYRFSHLCQYGGVKSHLPTLFAGALVFFIAAIMWIIFRKHKKESESAEEENKMFFRAGILIFIAGTVYFGGHIIYSAIPYNGKLSWKIDAWRRQKEVRLEHNNIFKDGVNGIVEDLDRALTLPEQLYLTNTWQMTFDENGTIQTFSAFVYGKDEKEKKKTYLIDYDAGKNKAMTVWINGENNGSYDEEKRLEPMITILNYADYEEKVKQWANLYENKTYEIKYTGYSHFSAMDGLQYLPGDVNGDGIDDTTASLLQLNAGGEIAGFSVSLSVSGEATPPPVHYIMEPEYISQKEQMQEQQNKHIEESKDAEGWTVDDTDGSMYFFLDDSRGWRLKVMDAAAGSRFYGMEATKDGGLTWEMINDDPFGGEIGVTEGLIFFDENWGFAGLTGASQSYSSVYVTRDGGATMEKIQLPMDTVTTLPDLAKECGFTIEDYDYVTMPEYDENKKILTITVLTGAAENEGITFRSQDRGKTWNLK